MSTWMIFRWRSSSIALWCLLRPARCLDKPESPRTKIERLPCWRQAAKRGVHSCPRAIQKDPKGAANEKAGSTRLLLPRPFRRNAVVRPDDLRPDPDGRARRLRLAVSKTLQGRAMPPDPDGQPARRDLQQDALSIPRDFRRGA